MNKTLKYVGLLAVLPLLTVAFTTNYVLEADALKSKGTGTSQYGSATKYQVCGGMLCSEYPGGYEQFQKDQKKDTGVEIEPVTPPVPAPETEMDAMEKLDPGSTLLLSRANVPATIPLHHGYYNGGDVYFIITDSSDETHANIITENQGWKVELAPLLKNAPAAALSRTYMFTNGVGGGGVHGFQGEVFTSTPAQADVYSALTSHVHVTWNDGATPRVLDSEVGVVEAEAAGEVTLNDLTVVLNMPQIIWPEGQMMVKEDKTLTQKVSPLGEKAVIFSPFSSLALISMG